ncbi:MAG TPA: solute carrier family 23 protein [Spirochaetales bacterium]|nr:solute carrier family 23 protein [Spirochaetales bacterium]
MSGKKGFWKLLGFRYGDDRDLGDGLGGLLPDEAPGLGRLVLFAIQQFIVMFPATVLVALLTGFHVSTTIFASGLATLSFILVTGGKIPLYYGSSFSYIAAIVSLTGAREFGALAPDALIGEAQFGIILSGLVSILVGLLIERFGHDKVEKVLPAEVTGPIAIVIGLSLAGTAMQGAAQNWGVALVTLVVTMAASVFLRGFLAQLPVLIGIAAGYLAALAAGLVDFGGVASAAAIQAPHFTLPVPSWAAVAAIMPIAIATIPESTAHLYQIDLYVNKLAAKRGEKKYEISDKLGRNLIGDGVGDIVSSLFGGPAGTNYGENISTMAVTRVFSVPVLVATAVLAILVSFLGKFAAAVNTIPGAVIGGLSVYLFGVIAVQGVGIMVEKKVDLFDNRGLAVIATILVIGIGGSFAFPGGMIPVFGAKLPAIATAAIWGILLNLVLRVTRKKG